METRFQPPKTDTRKGRPRMTLPAAIMQSIDNAFGRSKLDPTIAALALLTLAFVCGFAAIIRKLRRSEGETHGPRRSWSAFLEGVVLCGIIALLLIACVFSANARALLAHQPEWED